MPYPRKLNSDTRVARSETRNARTYQAEDCPFCENACEKMTELGLSYVIHNPRTTEGEQRNAQTHEELQTLGGEDQIPFLIDHQRGETMYGSDDVVNYLDEHYS